jgi:hypothetical protein
LARSIDYAKRLLTCFNELKTRSFFLEFLGHDRLTLVDEVCDGTVVRERLVINNQLIIKSKCKHCLLHPAVLRLVERFEETQRNKTWVNAMWDNETTGRHEGLVGCRRYSKWLQKGRVYMDYGNMYLKMWHESNIKGYSDTNSEEVSRFFVLNLDYLLRQLHVSEVQRLYQLCRVWLNTSALEFLLETNQFCH